MALPAVDDIWLGANPQVLADGYDGYRYKVVELKTRDGVDWAKLRMIGDTGAAGFQKWVRSEYMDASANWTIEAAPIP